ncbi:DUF6377 domain-containing protein [Chitinophaga sp. Hz27]|uniref:DUF6377 domain-containing protein n=1 Tax=Chitinophaga sp. Hz27 TaxID=3347169 RepID=UPI0035E3867D
MRYILLIAVLTINWCSTFAQQPVDAALKQLSQTIADAPHYDSLKESDIRRIKAGLLASPSVAERFGIYLQLYEEYKAFRYDSAHSYALKLQDVATQLNNKTLIQQAKLKLCFSLISAGFFKDAADSLNNIRLDYLPDSLRTEYYLSQGRFHYDMADFGSDNNLKTTNVNDGNKAMDSALALMQPGSFDYEYYNGLKNIRLRNNEAALAIYGKLLSRKALSYHEIALAASTASDIYIQRRQYDSAILLLIAATDADIKSSTKETSAAFNLATLLYQQGNVKDASTCIQLATSDAASYGARQRKVKITDILPLIESEKLSLVKKQERTWITYAAVVTCLLIGVILLILTVQRQVKKLKVAQLKITRAHAKEQETNQRLKEANSIKEEYIGYFFNANSEFFEKMEIFKRNLEQKIRDRKFDEIKTLSNNINLKAEKNYLLQDFDRIFLKLYPNFIAEFNQLFLREHQIELKEGELMNTDLRIFALIRLGIHDPEKIAHILQYSVNTINTYKTKIKNKSVVPNEGFEQKIMSIQAV